MFGQTLIVGMKDLGNHLYPLHMVKFQASLFGFEVIFSGSDQVPRVIV